MNANDPNVQLVRSAAEALGSLREDLVFVGGCAIGLLITDPARPPVRATNDVDVIAEVTTKADYYALAKKLKQLGFSEDGADVICRWRHGELILDVMPTDENILGFSNRWYGEAVRQASRVDIPGGKTIKLVTPPLLLATKIEAFYGRGHGDYGASHDIEDILTLVDGRPEVVDEAKTSDERIREYLKSEVDDLLGERAFVDTVPWHFGAADQGRAPIVIERLRHIAGL